MPEFNFKEKFEKAKEKFQETVENVKEQAERFRLDAEYEEPDRPEDVSVDEIKTPFTDTEGKMPEEISGFVIYWRILANLLLTIIGLVLIIVFLPRFIKFFAPFIIAIILSLIATPLVRLVKKRLKVTQKVSSALVIVVVIAAIAGILWAILYTAYTWAGKLLANKDQIVQTLSDAFKRIGSNLSGVYGILPENIQNAVTGTSEDFIALVQDFVNTLNTPNLSNATQFVTAGVDIIFSIIVCFISAYFFTSQRREIIMVLKKIVPKSTTEYLNLIGNNFKKAIGGYFKAQLKIMVIMFVIMFIWLQIMDVPLSALVAFGVAFLDFLPVFGMGAVYWPWIVIDVILGNYKRAILIGVLYAICQVIRQLLQPKLVSDAVEMNPLATLFFMYVGYKISGIWGLILGIPIGMILISLYKIGTFDRITRGIKIIAKGINDFRKY